MKTLPESHPLSITGIPAFTHVIRRKSDGAIYTGRVNSAAQPDYAFSKNPQDFYTYTLAGAHAKIARFPSAFAGCEVISSPF